MNFIKRHIDKLQKIRKIKPVLQEMAQECSLCPRKCGVNRLADETGVCGIGRHAVVASAFKHFGEEDELVGRGGSGTVFFSGCNLGCVFCQNYDISHTVSGRKVTPLQLAEIMLSLQEDGAENINLVTPTHVLFQIVEALEIAFEQGLSVPIVYNCGGYERAEVIQLLDGIIDIYMPDLKFYSKEPARKYMNAGDYFDYASTAIKEMFSQVGDLVTDERWVAKKGLLIRHLVMPGYVEETRKILQFIKNEISESCRVNVMFQYYPCGDLEDFPELQRRITNKEILEVFEMKKLILGDDGY